MHLPRPTSRAALLVTFSLALLTTPACILGFDADSVELEDPQDASGDLNTDSGPDADAQDTPDLGPDALPDLDPDADNDPQDADGDSDPGDSDDAVDLDPQDLTPDADADDQDADGQDAADLPQDLIDDATDLADPDLVDADDDLTPDLADPDLADPDLPDAEDPCPAGQSCDPGFNNALGLCQDGACAFDACRDGFGDCNNSLTLDGCEKRLDNDLANCGACDNQCEGANATLECVDSACVIAGCAPGYEDLNADPDDGCEAQRPMIAAIVGVTPINHGAQVRWELQGEGAAPAWYEISWGRSPTALTQRRRIPASRAPNLTANVGPLPDEGAWSFQIRTFGEQALEGDLSDPFTLDAWAPAGWFVRSPGLFASGLRAESSDFAVYTGLGSAGHMLDGGAAVIPSRQAPPAALFHMDMIFDGPEAGIGAAAGEGGQLQVTQDWGVTWASVAGPSPDPLGGVTFTAEGHLLALGQDGGLYLSRDLGQRWETVQGAPTQISLWSAAHTLTQDGVRGPTYVSGASEETVVIGVVEDGRFEQLPYQPQQLSYFTSLHMVSPQVGYAAGFQALARTDNGWEGHELADLPDLLTQDFLFRVSASADGERVLVASFFGSFWWSEDSGINFTRVALPALSNTDSNGWAIFAPLLDQEGPPWLVVSSEGHRARWQPGQSGYALNTLSEGFWGDLVGVGASADLRDIAMLTEDGRVLQAAGTPDNVRAVQALPNVRDAVWRDLAYVDTARVAIGSPSLVAARVGAAINWSRITLPDSIPDATLLSVAMGGSGVGGWIVGNNPNGVRLYRVNQSRLQGVTLAAYAPTAIEPLGFGSFRVLDVAISADGTQHALLANFRGEFRVWRGEGRYPDINWERIYEDNGATLFTLTFQEGTNNIIIAGDNGYLAALDPRGGVTTIPLPNPQARVGGLNGLAIQGVLFPHDAEHGWVFSRDGYVAQGVLGNNRFVWRWDNPIFGGDTRPNAGLRAMTFPSDNLHGVAVGPQATSIWTASGGQR